MDAEDQALRAASAQGDPNAKAALALRLLRRAEGREEGMTLLRAAADAGSGEALASMAVFEAGGIFGEPDWTTALGHLVSAAEAGWTSAADELRLLADDPSARAWKEMAQRAQIQRWLSPPPLRMVRESPRIGVIDQFLWPQACAWFTSLGVGKLKPATIYDVDAAGARQSQERTNSDYPFDLFNARVSTCLLQARIEAAIGAQAVNFEAMALMHYAPGQEFAPHCDYLDRAVSGHAEDIRLRGQRVLTFLVYLNDDFEGGSTDFPLLNFSHRGKRGDALVFANVLAGGAPDPRTLHAGRPPTRGEKWLLSQWIRDRPQQW